MRKKGRVGIITWHYYPNFGSALQAYALQKSIEGLGYNTRIINYKKIKYGKRNTTKEYAQAILHELSHYVPSIACRYSYPFEHFQKKFFKETHLVQNEVELSALCYNYDAIICGSDQIWAPNVLNPVYLLDFVPNDVKKISYAASIGLNSIPDNLIPMYRKNVTTFDSVSVREEKAAEILKIVCGISSEIVLDPTLLISAEHWKLLMRNQKNNSNRKYLFCYFLKADHDYRDKVLQYAKDNELNIIGYSANKNDSLWMTESLLRIGPCEFLDYIYHADTIITDSYHGTCFSLLFHKKFLTFERFRNTDKICQNSRIQQLQKYFSIERQTIPCDEPSDLKIDIIDYNDFEEKLNALRDKSVKFLLDSLEKKKC